MRTKLLALLMMPLMGMHTISTSASIPPQLTVSTQVVDFGTIFEGTSLLRTLTITNTGTEIVTVGQLGVSPDSVFAARYLGGDSEGGFNLFPGQSQTIIVMFTASGTGEVEGTLTITSSVPQKFVRLTARSVFPPAVAVSPDSFDVDIDAGTQVERTFTITNTGLSDLEFSISAVPTVHHSFDRVITPVVSPPAEVQHLPYPVTLMQERTSAEEELVGLTRTPGPRLLFAVIDQQYIVELDITSGAVLDTVAKVDFTDGSEGLAYDGRNLYFKGRYDGSISTIIKIDAETGARDTVQIGVGHIDGLAHSGSLLYALSGYESAIYAIDYESESIVDRIDPGLNFIFGGLAYGGSRQSLFATDPNNGQIHEIDINSGEVLNTISFSPVGASYGLAFSSSLQAVVLSSHFGGYYVLDPDDGSVIDQLSGPVSNALAGDEVGFWPLISFIPSEGVVPAGESAEVTVNFDATESAAGTYTAQIRVFTNEPTGQPSIKIPATLHVTGQPALAVADSLHFANTYLGTSSTRELDVQNTGTDTLRVTEIALVGDAFSAHPTDTLHIGPGESRTIFVRFEPTVVGESVGVLTLSTNAGESSVQLSGQASEAPVVEVAPDSISMSLVLGREATATLIVKNTGGSTLEWEAAAVFADEGSVLQQSAQFAGSDHAAEKSRILSTTSRQALQEQYAAAALSANEGGAAPAPSLSSILDRFNANSQSVTSVIPNRFDFDEGVTGDTIVDGGGDMYDVGNFISTNLGFINYTAGEIRYSPAFGGSAENYFTQKVPGLFVLAADLEGVAWLEISGNLGADGIGSVDASILETVVAGQRFQVFIKRVYDASDPSVNHMLIVDASVGARHEFTTNTDNDYHRLYDLEEADRLYYLLYAGDFGAYIDNDAALQIANTFLSALRLAPEWISLEPVNGSIEPGDSTAVDVRLSAQEIDEGRYQADVLIFGNGLDSTAIRTPVTMDVLLNVAVESPAIPTAFALEANYPNPVGTTGTTIRYALPRTVDVRLTVYDVIGRRIATLVDERQQASWQEVRFDSGGLPSGLYVYLLEAGDFRESRSMMVLK